MTDKDKIDAIYEFIKEHGTQTSDTNEGNLDNAWTFKGEHLGIKCEIYEVRAHADGSYVSVSVRHGMAHYTIGTFKGAIPDETGEVFYHGANADCLAEKYREVMGYKAALTGETHSVNLMQADVETITNMKLESAFGLILQDAMLKEIHAASQKLEALSVVLSVIKP